ncbi:MAG: MBL fold metallo-hydrolase [Thermoguttaceae bacterium]
MNRRFGIAIVVLLLTCSLAAAGEGRKQQKVSEHVWAYTDVSPMTTANSFGANAGVVVGSKGAMVVDTLISAKEGKRLLADVREVTRLPILWVVNTHYHLDHAWGNCVFEAEGARIVATSPAPKLLAERGAYYLAHADQRGLNREDLEGTTLAPATVTFSGTMSIDLGGIAVELRSLPHGHCPDNLLVWVPQDKVLFSGDLLFVGSHPFIGEGDVKGWLIGLDVMAAIGAEKIVPGHGRLAGPKDIAEMRAYLTSFDENATRLAQGKTQEDAAKLAEELQRVLPAQGRDQLVPMIEYNLRMKYLPQEKPGAGGTK